MDFNINQWINTYTEAVQKQFGNRVWFIGLQGSNDELSEDEFTRRTDVLIKWSSEWIQKVS